MWCKISSTFVYLIAILVLTPPIIHTQDTPQDYLETHNSARKQVGVRPLTWNDTIAAYSENYVATRVDDCSSEYSRGPYGENIANGSRNDLLTGTDIIRMWIAERANYDSGSNACIGRRKCRDYTQVVWQNSLHLGCARMRCRDGGYVFSCNYDPPGNIDEVRPAKILIIFGKVASILILLLPVLLCLIIYVAMTRVLARAWSCLKRKQNEGGPAFDVSLGDEFENGTGPRKFSHRELASATNNFCEEVKLGEGGFGAVYKGFLNDFNATVAVKKISRRSKQGHREYTTEVKIISQLRHRNTVKLIGWCHEKELILVYEFMPNGSLDFHLFKGKSLLSWDVRYRIVQGLASALLYLHEEGDHCVLHRDIKSSNIMLDSEFNAKLGDFGLARLVDHTKGSQTSTALAGTIGYMAPECLTAGKASKESDVFSFGVVALEITCGRRSIERTCDEAQVSLVPWVWESYGNNKLLDVVDKKLGMNFDIKQMECIMIVGLWCAHPARNLRPSIRQAIQALNFELALPNLPNQMPAPNYDVPVAASAPTAMSAASQLSLTFPR